MRAIHSVCAVMLLFALQFSAFAQSPEASNSSPQTEEAIHNELRQLRADVEAAINKGDIESLLSRVEDDVAFTTMNNDSTVGKESLRQYFVKWVKSPGSPVEKIETSIKPDALSVFLDPERKMALSVGLNEDVYHLKDKSDVKLQARWTAILSKRTGSWKLAALHYSSNIFDNPLQQKMRQMWIIIAIIASVAGTVLGFLIGRRGRGRAA